MRNIFVIPTDKSSRLFYLDNSKDLKLLLYPINYKLFERNTQHIYITSDEPIKDEDWCFDLDFSRVFKCPTNNREKYLNSKKIILTTDQDLIAEGIQQIDDEFLEWFVKNPSCEEVNIDLMPYDGTKSISKYWGGEYKIIIPKEEPKQETLEEAIERLYGTFEDCKGDEIKIAIRVGRVDAFYDAVKWQTERMYSEEDMRKAFEWGIAHITFEEWFNQYKKK